VACKGRPYFSGQPIEAGDHEHVAGREPLERFGQSSTIRLRA
jgi:hypothetical protein